ncbi:4Fe-4S binding protein [Geobacter pelophilus]|jgi:2-oxoglutarate ferredoxin oxidoreductase subunit delta|uniref:4Fe-4S binding protein n=1 Tax=Geoanaerobacter pelophilus TaxID=60036 RepID=A0AAW4L713_9BACT|nr:4Fe-4S binding protein [Geoanaerobacter pelophilus]MBT0664375.1 4Fe-4S binding protein [Geoanaerobacter pelophilus]
MPRIEIDIARCKGCELCTTICPQKIIVMSDQINAIGYHTALAPDQTKCTGCAFCAQVCPDVAIIVFK